MTELQTTSSRQPRAAARDSLLNRTAQGIRGVWRGVISRTGLTSSEDAGRFPSEAIARLRTLVCECLEAKGGEVSARLRAARLSEAYLALDDEGRADFLRMLARDFDVDHSKVLVAALGSKSRRWATLSASRQRTPCVLPCSRRASSF